MKSLFHPDSPLMKLLSKVADLMLLCIGNPPLSLIITALNLIPVIWLAVDSVSFLKNFIWFLLGGFAWIAYANGKLLHKLFEQLILQKSGGQES